MNLMIDTHNHEWEEAWTLKRDSVYGHLIPVYDGMECTCGYRISKSEVEDIVNGRRNLHSIELEMK